MHVEINDFQKRLLVKSLETFVSGIPPMPPTQVVNPIESMHDLVRTEITMLLAVLNGPGDLKPVATQHTFRTNPEKVV